MSIATERWSIRTHLNHHRHKRPGPELVDVGRVGDEIELLQPAHGAVTAGLELLPLVSAQPQVIDDHRQLGLVPAGRQHQTRDALTLTRGRLWRGAVSPDLTCDALTLTRGRLWRGGGQSVLTRPVTRSP